MNLTEETFCNCINTYMHDDIYIIRDAFIDFLRNYENIYGQSTKNLGSYKIDFKNSVKVK